MLGFFALFDVGRVVLHNEVLQIVLQAHQNFLYRDFDVCPEDV
jgi:hypothetical protein